MAGLGPFRFEWGEGPIHRLHPLSKLLLVLVLSWAAMGAAPLRLAPLLVLALAGLAAVGARPGELLRNARFLLPLALFVALFDVVEPGAGSWFRPQGFIIAALYLARLGLIFLFAELFFRSTSTTELADAATSLARRLPLVSETDPGFYLSLSLGFLPRSIEAYERCREAALARGLGLGPLRNTAGRDRFAGRGGLATGISWLVRSRLMVLESFVAGSLRAALRSAAALEARSYNPARTIAKRGFGLLDLALPLLGAALCWYLAAAS